MTAESEPDNRQLMLEHFREQAAFCDSFGSPFSARLAERLADDFEAGGPVEGLLGNWPRLPRADAVAVRLCGALHAAVLSGRAPELAAQYPAQRAAWDMDALWPLARAFLAREQAWVADFIKSAPQTNEVRRSIVLLLGFLHLAESFEGPIDTLELGASAGLNLNWDRFCYRTSSWSWGQPGALTIDTDWKGPPPQLAARPAVRSRAACDLAPLDLRDPAQRTRLRSYIWADQPERLARFDAAADLAVQTEVRVDRADAAQWVSERLSDRPEGIATVVYHSVFLQYPRRSIREGIRAAIEKAGARATPDAPLVWLRLEPEAVLGGPRDSPRIVLDMLRWPGGTRRLLALTDGHATAVEAVG